MALPGTSISSRTIPNAPVDPAQDEEQRRRIEESRRRLQQLTEGRATELANDPYQRSVMDFLQGTISGQNVPYSDAVKGAILAQQGRGFADAEAAQMEALRQGLAASGGSIYDPGYAAAQREAMSRRQGQNLDAMGELNARAGLENFRAQNSAAMGLSSARNAQNAQINQMNLAGADYRARDYAVSGGGGGGGGGGSRIPGGGGAPGGSGDTLEAARERLVASGFFQPQAQGTLALGSGGARAPTPAAQTMPVQPPTRQSNGRQATAAAPQQGFSGTGMTDPNAARLADMRNGVGQYNLRRRQ